MTLRLIPLGCALALAGCQSDYSSTAVINSGSYDWADQVRDAHGFPLPGWGNVIMPSGSTNSR